MSDIKIKTGVVFVRNGLWQVEVAKHEYIIEDQWPEHSVLRRGLHENRRTTVKILNSMFAKLQEIIL